MASLQDQLLKAGVIDKNKANKIKKAKHKQLKQTPKGKTGEGEARALARQAQAEKAERDREINRQRQREAERKAVGAQIVQLITNHRIPRDGDIAFQFADGKKIKKIYVNALQQGQLERGQVVIARLGESYELVPKVVAEKIQQRDQDVIVFQSSRDEADENDPYAGYEIPDDLMW